VSAALESAAMFDVAASASSSSSSSYSDLSEIPQLVDRHVIGYALSTAFVKDSRCVFPRARYPASLLCRPRPTSLTSTRREVKPISGVSYDLMQPAFLKLPLTTVNVDMAVRHLTCVLSICAPSTCCFALPSFLSHAHIV
jgi:hypothetical protein